MRWRGLLCLCLVLAAPSAQAHTMIMTQVLVSFARPGSVDVKVDLDLTLLLGSPQKYYDLVSATPAEQARLLTDIAPRVIDALPIYVGQQRLRLALRKFTAAQATKAEFLDESATKHSTFNFTAPLPADRGPLRLTSPLGSPVDYPVAYTVQIPASGFSYTRWLEPGVHESPPFDWASRVAPGAAAAPAFDPDALSWPRQLVLYLQLGFRHIVPEGTDHILFVLGLFFYGISWRKLLSQTTVFTLAHATTLFLSVYGIFRLRSAIVEPAIAGSIAVIAIENVFSKRITLTRLGLVFTFGLIHGLGFASSLSDVPFPRHEFFVALLGFNFGVDFGQLFVIGVAFLLVGWFRDQPWFRGRIAIPCSLAIAAIGIYWAVERIVYYTQQA
jgi:HupE / UreJ protein